MTRARTLYVALFLVALALPGVASAQTLPEPIRPFSAPTLRADGFSVTSNPASLAFVPRFHAGFVAASVPGVDTRPGLGWALAGAIPRIGGLGVAIDNFDGRTALSTGLALGAPQFALGVATTRWHSDVDSALDSFSTTRLSIASRMSNNIGVSMTVENVTSPRLAGTPIPRVYVPSVAMRTTRGTFESDIRYERTEGDSEADLLGLTALVRPIPGLRFFASLEARVRSVLDDARATVGLELASRAGRLTGGGTLATVSGEADTGFVAGFDMFGTPGPVFQRRGRYFVVRLSGDPAESPKFRLRGHEPTFTDTLVALDAAARDRSLDGVLVRLDELSAGYGQLFELREALRRVQAAGKSVAVHLERPGLRDLYVASIADYRIAAPDVSVLTTSLGVTSTYIGELLERLGVRADFVRIGDFKSAPERFTRSEPSPPSRAQLDAYLDDVWGEVVGAIARDTGRSAEAVRTWLSGRPLRGDALLADGFIHATGHADTIEQDLEELVGRPLRFTSDLTGAYGATWVPANQIAVLHIVGGIIGGSGGQSLFGHKTGTEDVDRAIAEIAGNPAIRAVVLRIDSPGGSAYAAERIHDAVRRLDERLPVVVSMGDVAASGGYYVGSIDAPIHASPQTLTGSIGIYAGNLALDELLGRIGVNRDSNERGGRASYFDGRAWSEEDRLAVHAHIESAYDLFIRRVAEARSLSSDDVRDVAQGRIWSGRDAAERGLVDGIDGFLGALDAARSAGGIRDDAPVSLVHYPRPKFGVGAMIGQAVRAEFEVDESVRDWLERLGMGAFAAHATSIEPGAPMAQLEWVLEQL